MKRSFVVVVMLASGLALSAAAQTPPAPGTAQRFGPATPGATSAPAEAPAGPAKIAVINFQIAVAQTNEGIKDFADLQKKYAPKEATLKALNDEIENLTKQLQAQGATLSDADRATRAKTIDDKKKQLDRETEDLRNNGQQDMQDIYNNLAAKVYDVMQSYVEQQGFTLVLDVSQQQSPVLYANQGTVITKAVVDAYNLKSGVPAPPPGEQPAPGAQATPRTTRPATSAPRQPASH